MLTVSDRWRERYPDAHVGVLALKGVASTGPRDELAEAREALAIELRSRYAGYDRARLKAEPIMAAYDGYYRQFDKTYHVQLQLETVIFKEKPIAGPSPLVEAMFMAELKNLLLTAGHDLELVEGGLVADVASGEERYIRLGGREQLAKEDDMMISDDQGVLSTVLYGPDDRTQLRPSTSAAVFTVYAPAGVGPEQVQQHLLDIEHYASLVAPNLRRQDIAVKPESG